MDKRIKKIDPSKMIEVSGFRMDSKDTKSIPYVKSEMFLTELMEEICEYISLSTVMIIVSPFLSYYFFWIGTEMDDYAKARYKDTQELTILKFIDDNGKMNPEISEVDFIQDGDLNKSLQHFVSFYTDNI